MGYYRINLTIASDCGEIFNLQSTVLFVGIFLNALMRPNLLFIPLYIHSDGEIKISNTAFHLAAAVHLTALPTIIKLLHP